MFSNQFRPPMQPKSNRLVSRLILALFVLMFAGMSRSNAGLHAQSGIGFGTPGFVGMPDTAYSGDTVWVGSFIKNYDSLVPVFNDTIQIQGYIDTGSAHINFSLPPITQFSLPPGDSLFFLLTFPFVDNQMGGQFRIGNNVIVVWPIVQNPYFGIHDSLSANVFVLDTISGLGPEYFPDEGVRCYPVPASGPMYVTSNNPHLHPKEITVRDASGKIVFFTTTPSFGIETESWANGVYLLDVIFDNGSRRVYKVVK